MSPNPVAASGVNILRYCVDAPEFADLLFFASLGVGLAASVFGDERGK